MGHQDQWGLPLGFMFAPTDEQLVAGYLRGKIAGESVGDGLIAEFDVYGCNPWELPRRMFNYPRGQLEEMYFFSRRHSVKGNGRRCGRTAGCGVWHGNGKDNLVRAWDEASERLVVVGHKTSFKFEMFAAAASSSKKTGRVKTSWLMHEYRLTPGGGDDCVLCKIYERKLGRELDDRGDDDGDQPQRQLKRRRVVADAASTFDPRSPDTPFLFCSDDPQAAQQQIDSLGGAGLDTVESMPYEQPEHGQHQQGSMAGGCETGSICGVLDNSAHQSVVAGNPLSSSSSSSSDDVFALEDIDALAGLPPLAPWPQLDVIDEAWLEDVLALEEPPAVNAPPTIEALPRLPSLLPSPPPDAEAPPCSVPYDDPIQHWPDFALDWDQLGEMGFADLLQQDVHPIAPSGMYYQY